MFYNLHKPKVEKNQTHKPKLEKNQKNYITFIKSHRGR